MTNSIYTVASTNISGVARETARRSDQNHVDMNDAILGAEEAVNEKCKVAYVLVTAAHNEEAFIGRTLRAATSQTLLPRRWVIVSDASTDGTDEIVREYAGRYPFIQLLRIGERHDHDFASKVYALNAGLAKISDDNYEFLGILDADVSFEPSYFASLLERFDRDPRLGLAGGFIQEECNGVFKDRPDNSLRSVPGAIQLFRRQCHETVGDYLPLKYGGEDWCAEIKARMCGWRVEAFPELRVLHHRRTGAAAPGLRHWYREGLAGFSLGSHPFFEALKCVRRLRAKPCVLGALARFSGFVWAYCGRDKRAVPKEVVEYLRSEQKERIRDLLLEPFRRLVEHPKLSRFGAGALSRRNSADRI